MNKKKEAGVPKFILVAIAIVVVAILFGSIVFTKFLNARKTYVENHEVATSKITLWENTIERKEELNKQIEDLKLQYQKKMDELFIDAAKSIDDVQDMLLTADVILESVSISESAEQGGKSSAGDDIYATTLSVNLYANQEKLAKVLHYFEQESIGSYYVNDMTIQVVTEKDEETGEEKETDLYSVSMKVTLYYYVLNTSSNTPAVSA